MFPTFDVPPQHAETVGARKARRAKEDETARRSSSATSQSSGSTRSVAAGKAERRGFGWFGKSGKKGVREISVLPTIKKPQQSKEPELEPEAIASLPTQQDVHRQPLHLSDQDAQFLHSLRSPPPLKPLPTPPVAGAFPLPPSPRLPLPPSPGLLSLPGTCIPYCDLHAT